MAILLLFSDYFRPVAGILKFLIIVILRFLRIAFRWNKRIELLELEYSKRHLFENSYLVIQYRFRNALWYRFTSIKSTIGKKPIVINLDKLKSRKIQLIVYGFFRKKVCFIEVRTENILTTDSFKTKVKGLFVTDKFTPNVVLSKKDLFIKKRLAGPKQVTIQFNNKDIHINHSLFNQTDFV